MIAYNTNYSREYTSYTDNSVGATLLCAVRLSGLRLDNAVDLDTVDAIQLREASRLIPEQGPPTTNTFTKAIKGWDRLFP